MALRRSARQSWCKIAMNQDTSYTFHAPCTDKPDAFILAVECWIFCRNLVRFTGGDRPELWDRRAIETWRFRRRGCLCAFVILGGPQSATIPRQGFYSSVFTF